ncbi:grpE domain-containing protein [Phthorimaea operculella]|nr:grpE domain-containing protein [Phthorimaea operculella]
MASLKVYSVGRLAKYLTDSTLRSYRPNIYRSSISRYSTEEKAKEPESQQQQPAPPATVEECHKKIEELSTEVTALKTQVNELNDKYRRALADGENTRRRMLKQVEDAKSFAIQSFCKDLLDVSTVYTVSP